MPPRGLQTSKGEMSAKKEYSSSHAEARMVYLQQQACNSCITQLWNPILGPCAPSLLLLLITAPSSSLFLHPQGIWSCHLQAPGKVAQAFPWSKQDVKSSQVPNRTDSSTCLKLNSWIKSRASKLTAWNRHTTDEGLSSPQPHSF